MPIAHWVTAFSCWAVFFPRHLPPPWMATRCLNMDKNPVLIRFLTAARLDICLLGLISPWVSCTAMYCLSWQWGNAASRVQDLTALLFSGVHGNCESYQIPPCNCLLVLGSGLQASVLHIPCAMSWFAAGQCCRPCCWHGNMGMAKWGVLFPVSFCVCSRVGLHGI